MAKGKHRGARKETGPAPTKPWGAGIVAAHWPLVVQGLLCMVFYFRILFGMGYLWEDIVEQVYPNLQFAVYCLKHGWLPHWTPYVFSGMPFLADPLSTVFYPPHWILFAVSMVSEPGGITFVWYQVLHIWLLGAGAWFLALHFRLHRVAALFVGVAATFTGYVTLHIIHANFIYVVAWVPLVFLFYDRALQGGKVRDLAGAALLLGISTLGGYPQYTLHQCYFLLLWTAFVALRRRREGVGFQLHSGTLLAAVVAFGMGLAAIQYLPALEMMGESARETMQFDKAVEGSVPLSRLLTFVAPSFYGYVAGEQSAGSPYWGFAGQPYFFWETNAFVGLITLLLALRALMDIRRKPVVLFFAACAALCLILALGEYTPLFGLVFRLAPGMSKFRIPGRFTLWASFCFILLAGMGLDMLLRRDRAGERRFPVAGGIFAGLVMVWAILFVLGAFDSSSRFFGNADILAFSRAAAGLAFASTALGATLLFFMVRSSTRTAYGVAAVFLVFLELFVFGHRFAFARSNPHRYYHQFDIPALRRELADGTFRIQSRLFRGDGPNEMLFPRNMGNVLRVPLTEGYNQLILERYREYLYKIDEDVGARLLNVRYKKMRGEARLRRLDPVDRFYLSSRYRVFSTQEELIAFVNSDRFVPGVDIALEATPTVPRDSTPITGGSVRLVSENPNRIELEVTSPQPALLSASEVYYPAWKARVDGDRTPVYAANLLFRAVEVPAGTHRVVMYFQSDQFRLGMLVTLLVLAALAGVWVAAVRVPRLSFLPFFHSRRRASEETTGPPVRGES